MHFGLKYKDTESRAAATRTYKHAFTLPKQTTYQEDKGRDGRVVLDVDEGEDARQVSVASTDEEESGGGEGGAVESSADGTRDEDRDCPSHHPEDQVSERLRKSGV